MPQPVLLPDNNVWVNLVQAQAIEVVQKESKRLGVAVAACPAIGFEFIRANDKTQVKSWIEALTRGSWKRLMPEAFKECEEARRAIARFHPEWLRTAPDLRSWYRLKADWEHGWWLRIRKEPLAEASRLQQLEGELLETARSEAKARRREAERAKITFDSVNLDVLAKLEQNPGWWDGEPFEPWRLMFASIMFTSLERGDDAYSEWLAPWLINGIREADWYQMWLREIARDDLPLAWLRWAFEFVQATRTTTNGTPIDNQIATYLPECDVFVTSDKAFSKCVEKIRPQSPVQLGRGLAVPSGDVTVDAVLEAMRDMSS